MTTHPNKNPRRGQATEGFHQEIAVAALYRQHYQGVIALVGCGAGYCRGAFLLHPRQPWYSSCGAERRWCS